MQNMYNVTYNVYTILLNEHKIAAKCTMTSPPTYNFLLYKSIFHYK